MRKLAFAAFTSLAALCASTGASAALVGGTNVDFSAQPFTFGYGGNNFTLSYAPNGSFDPNPVFFQTSGTAAATAFGGFLGIPLVPSTSFTSANAVFGPNAFPGFAAFPTATAVPFSIVDGDLGLRVTIGADNFYGYARFGGSTLTSYAFETNANQEITAGSFGAAVPVPEPATWAMMIGGFGAIGGAMRVRTRRERKALAAA